MNEDIIWKEAESHCKEVMCSVCNNRTCTQSIHCREWRDRRAGYYCGAESREKLISELENKVTVLTNENNILRNCYNCKKSQEESYCIIRHSDVNDLSCWDQGCDEWEMRSK